MTEPKPRYVLYDRIAEGEIETYLARAPNGEHVMVHLLGPSSARGRRILEGLDRMSVDDRARVRAIDSVDGAPVIVTDVLESFGSLPAWLDSRLSPPVPSDDRRARSERGVEPASGEGASERSDTDPGEFTRLFELGGTRTPGETGTARPAGDDEPALRELPDDAATRDDDERTGREPDASPEPGEFTRLFLMQDALARSREPTDDAEGAPPTGSTVRPGAPERQDPPGDREGESRARDVREPSDSTSGRPGRPPDRRSGGGGRDATAAGTGEFTRLFSGGASGGERDAGNDPAGWGDLRDPPEWSASASAEPSSVDRAGDDYLERLARSTHEPGPQVSPVFESPVSDPAPPDGAPGPSRYTEVLRGGQATPEPPRPPQPPPPPPKPDAPPKPPSKRRYLIALIVILVLAIAFVVVLALSTRAPSSDAEGGEPDGGETSSAAAIIRPAGAG